MDGGTLHPELREERMPTFIPIATFYQKGGTAWQPFGTSASPPPYLRKAALDFAIQVGPCRRTAPASVGHSGDRRHFPQRPVTAVVPQSVGKNIRDVEIIKAVVIEVAYCNGLTIVWLYKPGTLSDVVESQCVQVPKEFVQGLGATIQCAWISALIEHEIPAPVVVEIEPTATAANGLHNHDFPRFAVDIGMVQA